MRLIRVRYRGQWYSYISNITDPCQVSGAQLWATVILAQILHALQVQVAVESGVETFDVSLELLWRYLPELSQLSATQGQPLLEVIKEVGVALKLIRPSTRIRRVVPDIDWQEITPLPADLVWIREPHYAHKTNETRSCTSKKTKKEPGVI